MAKFEGRGSYILVLLLSTFVVIIFCTTNFFVLLCHHFLQANAAATMESRACSAERRCSQPDVRRPCALCWSMVDTTLRQHENSDAALKEFSGTDSSPVSLVP
jgi:hypothetical protein